VDALVRDVESCNEFKVRIRNRDASAFRLIECECSTLVLRPNLLALLATERNGRPRFVSKPWHRSKIDGR